MRTIPRLHVNRVSDYLIAFLRDEFKKAGFRRAVLGLSGGVDSSVVAALCAEALGRANTYGIILPCHTAAGAGLAHARLIVKTLGICHLELDITAQVETYFKNFPQADSVRRGNKIARERMSVLYDLSSHFGALVVGTSNKSERYLGYGTIYGDMACAINPVGDLYKTEMYQLAEYLKIPAEIVRKAPSAELWPGQTDEDELGFSYAEIDQVLHAYVDRKLSPEEIVRNLGLKETLVKRVAELVRKSEFKRRLPLVANIPQEIKYVKEP